MQSIQFTIAQAKCETLHILKTYTEWQLQSGWNLSVKNGNSNHDRMLVFAAECHRNVNISAELKKK